MAEIPEPECGQHWMQDCTARDWGHVCILPTEHAIDHLCVCKARIACVCICHEPEPRITSHVRPCCIDWVGDFWGKVGDAYPLIEARVRRDVFAALAEQGLVVVARDDLAETVKDAHTFNDVMLGGDDAATARLDRLQAALSGTLHAPQGPVSVSAPPATHRHAGAPPNPPSDRTSPLIRIPGPTTTPRIENP